MEAFPKLQFLGRQLRNSQFGTGSIYFEKFSKYIDKVYGEFYHKDGVFSKTREQHGNHN
jgi:hypothetical protein